MPGSQGEIVREELFSCPCCMRKFFAKVTYDAGGTKALHAFHLMLCNSCKRPCCPYCEHVGGQQAICTRCTRHPDCSHTSADPQQELYQRLFSTRGKARRIEISWNASDGGPRMDVRLRSSAGDVLDEWNDWAMLSQNGGVDDRAMKEIIKAAVGEGTRITHEAGTYFTYFEIH